MLYGLSDYVCAIGNGFSNEVDVNLTLAICRVLLPQRVF